MGLHEEYEGLAYVILRLLIPLNHNHFQFDCSSIAVGLVKTATDLAIL